MKLSLHVGSATLAIIMLANTASAQLTVFYQDNFDRSGPLAGSMPSTDTNGNTWTVNGTFNMDGSSITAYPNGAGYGNAFLPVNGTSGITLDGTVDFTLSVDVTTGGRTADNMQGIYLSSSALNSGSIFDNPTNAANTTVIAALGLKGNGQMNSTANQDFVGANFGLTTTGTLTLSYNATTSIMSYILNGTTYRTTTLTPTQIASATYIAVGSGYNSYTAGTLDNFTLSVAAVPEPSAWGLVGLGCVGLLIFRRRQLKAAQS